MVCILNGYTSTHVTCLILPLGLETSLALSESITPGSERATAGGGILSPKGVPFQTDPAVLVLADVSPPQPM